MKLKPLPADRVIKILTKIGFHKGEVIGRGLLLKIIKDVKLSKEEFLKLIESL